MSEQYDIPLGWPGKSILLEVLRGRRERMKNELRKRFFALLDEATGIICTNALLANWAHKSDDLKTCRERLKDVKLVVDASLVGLERFGVGEEEKNK